MAYSRDYSMYIQNNVYSDNMGAMFWLFLLALVSWYMVLFNPSIPLLICLKFLFIVQSGGLKFLITIVDFM
jgi:hypothetical protein